MIDSNVEGPGAQLLSPRRQVERRSSEQPREGESLEPRGIDDPDATMDGVDQTASIDRARSPPKQRWADFGSDGKSDREIRTVSVGRLAPRPANRKTVVAAGRGSHDPAVRVAEGPAEPHRHRRITGSGWATLDSNQRPSPCKGDALTS